MPQNDAAIQAAQQFLSTSDRPELAPLGRGLINDTYRVTTGTSSWVLQRINRQVFPDPVAVMKNLRRVTDHASRVRRGCLESPWRLPEVIPTRAGDDVYQDAHGEYWRAITYIDQTYGLSAITRPEQAEQVGRALGWFHGLVGELPAESLHDTLPGFHVTPGYLIEFDAVVAKGWGGPDGEGLAEALEFVESRRPCADVLELARSQGRLKPHVIHGDPKLDNVLFDIASGQAVSLIDLDTVKPGLLHYDLGDCFRSCCNKVSETVETGGGAFDVGVFRAVLQGYLREASSILTREDLDYLYDAIRLLPFELGLRFLTDHLAGNVYFKVQAPGQNLERAVGQFRLSASVETFEGDIRRVLAALT